MASRPLLALGLSSLALAPVVPPSVAAGPELVAREVTSPAGPGSLAPSFAVSEKGEVALSWLEPSGGGHALRFSSFGGGRWSAPRTVVEGEDLLANWADVPSLALFGGKRIAAQWLTRRPEGRHAYDARLAFSRDRGRSFGPPLLLNQDSSANEHGFVTLVPLGEGRLAAAWLDGRAMRLPADAGTDAEPEGDMQVRLATFSAAGERVSETVLDPRVCECCSLSSVLTSRGLAVFYRDRSAGEVRDIARVRVEQPGVGPARAPEALHRDGWEIAGCPVNGPAAEARGERLAVAWFTAAEDRPRVYVAFSGDAGESYSAPVRIDDGDPLGRVDLVLLDDGSAVVSWLEAGEPASVRVRHVAAEGPRGAAQVAALTSARRASGFPRLARAGQRLLLAWTEDSGSTRVRTTLLEPGRR